MPSSPPSDFYPPFSRCPRGERVCTLNLSTASVPGAGRTVRRPFIKRRAMMSRSVDLPAPDAPINATSDPVSKWHDTSLIAAGFWKSRRGNRDGGDASTVRAHQR